MSSAIEIVVQARDEASRVLENVKGQLVVFDQFGRVASQLEQPIQRTAHAVGELDTSFLRAGRSVRRLSLPLISELSPALGQTESQLAGVAMGAALLGTGFTALGLAAAGVAGIVGGKLITAWREGQAAAEGFQKALGSGDLEQVSAQYRKLSDDISGVTQALRELEAAPTPSPTSDVGLDVGVPGGGLGTEASRSSLEAQRRRLEERRRIIELQRDTLREGGAPGMTLAELNRLQGEQARMIFQNQQAQRGLFDFRLDPIDQALQQQLRQATDLERGGDPEAAARLRGAAGAQRRFALGVRFAAGAPVNPFETVEGQEAERKARDQMTIQEDAADRARIEAFQKGAPVNPFETEAGQEAARHARDAQFLKDEDDRLKLVREEAQLKTGLLEVERNRLDVLGQLTPELSAQLTMMQAAVIAADETLTPQQKQLAFAQANLAVMKEMVSLDPLAGLVAGFSRVATESHKLGTELERFANETAGNMAQSFSDHFFNLFTGTKGQDLGRQFGDLMLRSFTDLVGRQLSGAVSGLFSRALGGFAAMVPGGGGGGGGFDILNLLGLGGGGGGGGAGPILSATGSPAGSVVMTQAGPGLVMPSGSVQLLSGATGGPGGGFGSFLPSPSTLQAGFNMVTGNGPSVFDMATAFSAGGLNAVTALNAGQAVISGGQFISNAGELAMAGVSSPGVGGASAGMGFAGAASGVLAGVALGFTIFSGLQGEPTAMNIAIGTVSGAVSGAVLGGAIGGAFGGPAGALVGGVIGALAGGLLGGGSAALGKGGQVKKPSANERSAAVAEMSAGNLSAAIDAAQSLEDLQQILNMRWSPYNEVNIVAYDRDTHWVGSWTNGPAGALALVKGNGEGGPPFPDVGTMLADPRYIEFLEIQVGAGGSAVYRQDLTDKFKAKWVDLLETFSNIPFGILESDRAAGLTRRTYLPFQELYKVKPGSQQLFGSSEFYKRDLGATDDTVAFLIDRIREHSLRRDIDMTRDDFLFR